MFNTFYALNRNPFTKEIKKNELFCRKEFNEGLERLNFLKDTRGIGLLLGEAGSGKTTLLRSFAQSLNDTLFRAIYFPLATLTVNDFYRGLVHALGAEPAFRKVDMFLQIQNIICDMYHKQRITPVIILDEIHMARNDFLSDICLLLNFEMDSQNPFVLILCGLPHFAGKLKLEQHQPLKQRIILNHNLSAFNMSETGEYINHLLEKAGAKHTIFDNSAIEAIASNSRGIPRLINSIASYAMIYGMEQKLNVIDAEAVFAASNELRI